MHRVLAALSLAATVDAFSAGAAVRHPLALFTSVRAAPATVDAFSVGAAVKHPLVGSAPLRDSHNVMRRTVSVTMEAADEVWSRYILLRPSPDECALEEREDGGESRHVLGTTCGTERKPGTLRTFLFSSVLCLLVAVPVLLTSPLIFPMLIEVSTPWCPCIICICAHCMHGT